MYRSIVHVPEQKLGAERVRILMSSDNLDPASLLLSNEVKRHQLDNFVKEEEGVDVTGDNDASQTSMMNGPCANITENYREGDYNIDTCKGEAPFEESNMNSSRHGLTDTDK